MSKKHIAQLLLLLLTTLAYTSDNRIILCTYFTKSHNELAYNWMLPSILDDFEIHIGNGPQVCEKAAFYTPGWTETTLHKAMFIRDIVQQNKDRIIVFADPDILFFKPIEPTIRELLKTYEFAVQKDAPDKALCSGFFAMIANENICALWNAIVDYMEQHHICDQGALNYFLNPRTNRFNIRWLFLPTDMFCGGGTFKKWVWHPGVEPIVPKNIAMFHANYAPFGRKQEYLARVQSVVEKRRNH